MDSTKNTPMIKQYLSIKKKYADTLLLYRMGDFYEMFFNDAYIASEILDIVLTSRNKNDKNLIAMCGFPYRAAHTYIAKLVAKGYKVAVCDQIGEPIKGNLVERKVVRIITPGMVVDADLLDSKTNNFILALNYNTKIFGISFLDISTGAFFLTELFHYNDVIDEITRVSPSEILLPKCLKNTKIHTLIETIFNTSCVSFTENSSFNHKIAYQSLLDQFNTISLECFNCNEMDVGVSSAGALIKYVHETQRQKIDYLKPIKPYYSNNFLIVDRQSCKNLELFKGIRSGSKVETLINVIDVSITSMGGRLLNNWLRYPLINQDKILQRQDAVYEALENQRSMGKIRQVLNSIFDLERLASKISMGNSNPRDLNTLKKSIQVLPDFFELISTFKTQLYHFTGEINILYDLVDLIQKSIRDDASTLLSKGFIIKEGFSSELDELIDITRNAKKWIINLEIEEKKITNINSLKVRYNKIFGYYIEVPKARSKDVPNHYMPKQTLVNSVRYTTDELNQFENKISNAENRKNDLELEIFKIIIKKVKLYNRNIQEIASFISLVDCLTSLALVALENDYCRPNINSIGVLDIEACRHPVVEKIISGERFVPNSIKMDNDQNQLLIITGPNMAGKSTVLRQTALCIILAQMGSFVPASQANIPITDRIFTRIGALDNLAAGQSTFMVEMQETANILNSSTRNSFVIIDEIGRGTSTFDGLSIAWAIAEYLHDIDGVGVKSMLATHYHELTKLEKYKHRVKNFNTSVKEINDEIIFMRKLVKGSTNKSYGIQVARLAGMPMYVVERSKQILRKLNNGRYDLRKMLDDDLSTSDNIKKERIEKETISSSNFIKKKHVISMLEKADILNMNPIDALNYLNKLQIELKTIS